MSCMKRDFTDMRVGESENFSYDFVDTLPTGATIASVATDIVVHAGVDPNPQALVVGGPTISGSVVTIRLNPTLAGVSYRPRVTATYSDGQIVTLPDPGEGSLKVIA